MHRLFSKTSFRIFVVVVAALLIGSMISIVSHSKTSPLNRVTSFVFSPSQKLAAAISNGLSDMPFSFRSASKISEEKDALQAEVNKLRNQLIEYEEIRQENDLYREFLQLKKDNPDQQYCEASVIGRNGDGCVDSLVLNKGSLAGISVQDPVVYGSNLVGVVASVTPTTCTVRTLLNPEVNVSCREIRTSTLGYSTTTVELAQQGQCHMPNLSGTTSITIGGIICTSGVGGVYPADLIIGTVADIIDATVDISAAAVINPAVDFESISGVFVITEFEGQGLS